MSFRLSIYSLRRHDIQVVNKPFKTLQQEFPSPKIRHLLNINRTYFTKYPVPIVIGVMQAKLAGVLPRKKKHIRNVKTCATGSNIAKHAWSFDHRIDFDNSSVIDKGCFRIRKTLEAWHTSATKHADNNFKPTPNQYSILFKPQSPNLHVYTFLLSFFFLLSRLICIYFQFAFHFYPSKAID